MSFRDAFKRRTPGYAGGTLEDQLLMQMYGAPRRGTLEVRTGELEGQAPPPMPRPNILTPANREAIIRPRTVAPAPEEVIAAPSTPSFKARFTQPRPTDPTFNGQSIIAPQLDGEPFGTRERRVKERDHVADKAQDLRDAQVRPRDWRDKVVDVLDALSTGLGNKPRTTLTKRERQIKEAESGLGRELVVGQKQAQIAQGQMVPVTLEDGTEVQVPARSAGGLQSQQQKIRQSAAESERRKEMDKNRVAHWNNMDATSRKRLIAGLYGSGALNSPDLLEYAADELGVPGTLREKFINGQMRDAVDEHGNLIQVNRQTQEVLPVTRDDRPVGSFAKTQEAGRERRFNTGQANVDRRAAVKGTSGRGTSNAQTKAANALVAKYNYLRKAEMSTDIDPKQKPEIQRQRETVWQQVMDTYPGMFEADEKTFELRPKAGAQESSPAPRAGKLSESTVRQAAVDAGLDADEAVRRAKAKGRL